MKSSALRQLPKQRQSKENDREENEFDVLNCDIPLEFEWEYHVWSQNAQCCHLVMCYVQVHWELDIEYVFLLPELDVSTVK